MHCLDGRRITSLLILLLRRIQGWSPIPTFSEYWRFQVSSHTLIPTAEVEKTTKELEKFATEIANVVMPDSIPRWLWEGDRGAVVSGVKLVSKPQAK